MNVAIIAGPNIPVPPEKYGGTEQVLYYLVKGLKEQGHTPILFGAGNSQIDCEVVPIIDEALYYPKLQKDLPQHYKKERIAKLNTRKLLRQNLSRIDIIHSHGFDLSPFAKFPNLTTIHSAFQFSDFEYYLKRANLFYASISNSQQAACPDLKFVGTIYNGEDPTLFPVVTEPEDYLCFLGRFDRDKNPHLALQLAISLGMKIKLAGKIDYLGEDYFKDEIEPHLKNPLVEYLGELNFEQKVKLLSNAKCNLHPSNFREPFGLTVLEAAYCGTPTLATARGSMPELIEDGRTGILVEDYVEGIKSLEKCYEMDRSYIATRSRMLFNYKNMTEQYVLAYQKIIEQFEQNKGLWAGTKKAIKAAINKYY